MLIFCFLFCSTTKSPPPSPKFFQKNNVATIVFNISSLFLTFVGKKSFLCVSYMLSRFPWNNALDFKTLKKLNKIKQKKQVRFGILRAIFEAAHSIMRTRSLVCMKSLLCRDVLWKLNIYLNISSVMEFQRWWVLKSKIFAQESTRSKEILIPSTLNYLWSSVVSKNQSF